LRTTTIWPMWVGLVGPDVAIMLTFFGEGGVVGLLPTGHDLVELFDEVVPLLCGEVVEGPVVVWSAGLFCTSCERDCTKMKGQAIPIQVRRWLRSGCVQLPKRSSLDKPLNLIGGLKRAEYFAICAFSSMPTFIGASCRTRTYNPSDGSRRGWYFKG
jgi:hypothetical protein